MVHDVVRSLDDTKRRAYFSLQQLPDGDLAGLPGSAEAAAGVWMTNAYPTSHAATDDGAGDGQAVFELISRLNHDCHPNTHLSWNAELGKQTCHAARDIARGEELTVAYWHDECAEGAPRRERQQRMLRSVHGFQPEPRPKDSPR